MSIPRPLLDQIEQGNVVLFLGAGASFGSVSPNFPKIPNGQELSDMIAKKFLDDTYLNSALSFVSEVAQSETDLFTVQKFIYDIITPFEPNEKHKLIPTFKWRSIYTTNYDFIIEKSYSAVKDSIQDLSVVIRNTRVQNIHATNKSLPYYKIHGCLSIINDLKLPLILTPDQYINHSENRERLFNKLLEEAHDYTFVFVGYSFADIEIRSILQLLEKEKEGRPRFYMVGPSIREAEESFWETKRISSLKMTFDNFLAELDGSIPKNNRTLSKARPTVDMPIYHHFFVDVNKVSPSESFRNFLEDDIEYVHSSMPTQSTDAKEFYKGYFVNWDPIVRNLDVKRDLTESILSEVFLEDYYSNNDEKTIFILIKGFAGSGKSVLLKRLAWDAAVSFEKLCIFYKPNTVIRYDNILELHSYVRKRIFIFVEDLLNHEDELKRLIEKCVKENLPVTIVGCERTNTWNQDNNQLSKFLTLDYSLEYLNNKEIKELLLVLRKFNSLGHLSGKTEAEQLELLGEKAGRVLLVALYEATHGKPFRDIIKHEYDTISTDTAKSLYLTVSILHMLGSYARAGLISRVHGIGFDEFKKELFLPLEYIVFDRKDYKINDYIYQTRHPYIAEIVFEMVLLEEQQRFDEIIRILTYLDIDYDSDRNAFIYLTSAKRLLKLFSNSTFILNVYKKAGELTKNNSKLYQQMAIYEIEKNNIIQAEKYIAIANDIEKGNDPVILHTFAELEYKKSELAKSQLEKISLLDKSVSLCDSLIRGFGASIFSFHTLLKSLNQKLELSLRTADEPTIERLIKDIEKRFRDAKQAFPSQEFILEAESRFNAILNNSPEALELLEKAYKLNKSSPYIAMRLSNFYESNGRTDDALNTLKVTLDHIPGDKDINFSYAFLYLKKYPNNYNESLYYLKKSFTQNDSRHSAQFWCARSLYLNNNIEEGKLLFKKLSSLAIDPLIKNYPDGLVVENGKKVIFRGKAIRVETTYAFVKREAYGDDVFLHRFENHEIWHDLKSGDNLSFNIAFNYKGAIALNVKLL
jgi:tetratricopeptide (TPR) repeat protein